MLLTGSRSIRDVILFPLMRNREQASAVSGQGTEASVQAAETSGQPTEK
jgi:aspartyl-tRNA synthetase